MRVFFCVFIVVVVICSLSQWVNGWADGDEQSSRPKLSWLLDSAS